LTFVGNNIFGEIMYIWAKENKRKEEELQKQSCSLWAGPVGKKDKKKRRNGSRAIQTKKYPSFLFHSIKN